MKKFLCIALALMLVVARAACDSDSDSIVGKYYFQEMVLGENVTKREDAAAQGMTEEQLDAILFFEITAEGKGILTSNGTTAEMEFDSNSIWPVEDPDEKAEFSLVNGVATIYLPGSTADNVGKMVFKK